MNSNNLAQGRHSSWTQELYGAKRKKTSARNKIHKKPNKENFK
jgi:hypothetical protein